jgi:plasmid stability protein
MMDEVIVIELEDEIIAQLEEGARRHGRTLDEEVRVILAEASRKED